MAASRVMRAMGVIGVTVPLVVAMSGSASPSGLASHSGLATHSGAVSPKVAASPSGEPQGLTISYQVNELEGADGAGISVNNWGQVVGMSSAAAGTREQANHAVIWRNGKAIDLNSRVHGYDGHLLNANDINDAGVITGQAITAGGEVVEYRATPLVWPLDLRSPLNLLRPDGHPSDRP